MEEQRTNGNSCKNKWVLAITAIIILAGSNIYFFTKYNEQSKLIENQLHYINELNANITKSSLLSTLRFWFSYFIILPFQLFTNWWLTSREIVIYNSEAIIGLRLAGAPIEDLIFGFAMILAVMSLWESKTNVGKI